MAGRSVSPCWRPACHDAASGPLPVPPRATTARLVAVSSASHGPAGVAPLPAAGGHDRATATGVGRVPQDRAAAR